MHGVRMRESAKLYKISCTVNYAPLRSAEVLAHRLRLGKCRLDYYLHKIALHDTGTCDSCGQTETIEHYLINCSENEIAAAVKNICDQRKISFTLPTILRQVAVLEELRHLTHRQL